jgi:hypothetical protein
MYDLQTIIEQLSNSGKSSLTTVVEEQAEEP